MRRCSRWPNSFHRTAHQASRDHPAAHRSPQSEEHAVAWQSRSARAGVDWRRTESPTRDRDHGSTRGTIRCGFMRVLLNATLGRKFDRQRRFGSFESPGRRAALRKLDTGLLRPNAPVREAAVHRRRRGRRFAKVARDQKTGLKFTISGQFSIGSLVGVGCRLMVLGPSLGTLAGTLEPMPMCAY